MSQVVITGCSMVSPLGIGRDAMWNAMNHGQSGVRHLTRFDASDLPVSFGAEVIDFEPKQYIRPRKSLKVMSHDITLGFAAADLARQEANLEPESIDSDRLGVVFGADMIYCDVHELIDAFKSCTVNGDFDFTRWGEDALGEMAPLWMLKYLPNMTACHVGIAMDAQGPNNSITLGDVSSLLALVEAASVIRRGQADVMIAGGASSAINPSIWTFRNPNLQSHRNDNPAAASRPFDADRDGMVAGEGAAAFVLERRDHAEARGANILATILGHANYVEPNSFQKQLSGEAIRRSIETAIQRSDLTKDDIGHVNAHGVSTITHDAAEAQAIAATLGDIPVTAPKSYFGNLGAASGAVEALASILAFEHGQIPPTLNYETPDPNCPINVASGSPQATDKKSALLLNQAPMGQAIAVVIQS